VYATCEPSGDAAGHIYGLALSKERIMNWTRLSFVLAALMLLALFVVSGETRQAMAQDVKVKKMKTITVDVGDDAKMSMVLIPAGKFKMGCLSTEVGARYTEGPRRVVTITKPFYIGVYEVTQRQFEAVTGKNPSLTTKGDNHPVQWVNWFDARKFCKKLSEKTGKKYRLPTEAEWEYACRAGTETPWFFGKGSKDIGFYAWYSGNSKNKIHPVGQKKPNPWGLYDIYGNVSEWIYDGYLGRYKVEDTVDPTGRVSTLKVRRGGAYLDKPTWCRSARRREEDYTIRLPQNGFRVVLEVE